MKISNENIVHEFVRRFSQRLVSASIPGLMSSDIEEITAIARDGLQDTLDGLTRRGTAVDKAFTEGVLDSHRPSKGMTGPFVESSQEPQHAFAEHVHGGLRQEQDWADAGLDELDIVDGEVVEDTLDED